MFVPGDQSYDHVFEKETAGKKVFVQESVSSFDHPFEGPGGTKVPVPDQKKEEQEKPKVIQDEPKKLRETADIEKNTPKERTVTTQHT